ncbi:MAG: PD40 domain-containing protein [Gemmatimonadota bacterium]|nr:MAG: PD40 domain-containing protein [Gemmatimonadota bacterium]
MRLTKRLTLLATLAGAVGLGIAAQPAEAQYFGRNKVQYESFDFEVLKTEHFDIYYYPEVQVELAALMAERWYARLSRILNHDLSGRQALIVYAAHPHFQQSNAVLGTLDEATQGVTELLKRRIVLPFLGPLKETDHVIGHELVHAFQFDITGEGGGTLVSGIPGAARMPLWFVEGMAEYLSVGHVDSETSMWMRSLVSQDVSVGAALESQPYQYGQAIWAYIAGRWGDDVVGRLLKAVRATPSAGAAIQRVLRMSPDSLLAGWYEESRRHAEPLVTQTEHPTGFAEPAAPAQLGEYRNGWPYGQPILGAATGSGRYNISPALSPDGNRVIYLSEKDLFAIEMFMADARTGEVQRKIVKSAVDPHFEGLQFVHSAGGWDATGTRFAFAAIRKGQPALSIIDPNTGRKVHEKVFRELGEIFNPSWSPDGNTLVFSAIVRGVSDLYTYDIETETLNRLTNDAFGDVHPVWSPDGSTIAFVTERFTTGLTSLMHGDYGLALLDPSTGAIRELRAFASGKHTNPQWAPDGESLYFVSDQNGIANVYRMELVSGDIHQVTNMFTGVAGISPLSPAMSVASQTGEMTLSVHRGAGIDIYRLDSAEVLAGRQVIETFEDTDPSILVPVDRRGAEILSLINNPFFGLPRDTTYASVDYKPGLGLDYVSQPSLVIGVDRFGTYIGGGVSLFWSDMLGGHNLATMFQINGGIKDISAAVAYANMNRRLNWGVTLQQTSYLTGGFIQFLADDPDVGTVVVEQLIRYRQIYRELRGTLAYPLSTVQRLEFSSGVQNITYDFELQQNVLSYPTGVLLDQQKTDLPAPDALNLANASLALVYDNSFFGIASPILGQRYRIEAAPTFGSLSLVTGLFDFRKYIMPVRPFTIAARLMHYGRYGKDAEDYRLQPLSMGYPGLVRGYDVNSFNSYECTYVVVNASGASTCDAYEQLLGSKMIIGNLEVRFPPLGVLGLGDGFFGFLPLEMGVFVDGGIAWGSDDYRFETPDFDERAWFLGGDRKPVWSTGVSLRFNMFNYFILGVDWVKPFQRPEKGWYLQFNMVPGF